MQQIQCIGSIFSGLSARVKEMKISVDLDDKAVARIVVEELQRTITIQWALQQKGAADEDAEQIIDACKTLSEYFKTPAD
jgi:hypothetical protein